MAKPELYRTANGERRFQVAAPVTEDCYRALRRLAEEQGTTLAAVVRQAVSEYVTHRTRPSRRITKA